MSYNKRNKNYKLDRVRSQRSIAGHIADAAANRRGTPCTPRVLPHAREVYNIIPHANSLKTEHVASALNEINIRREYLQHANILTLAVSARRAGGRVETDRNSPKTIRFQKPEKTRAQRLPRTYARERARANFEIETVMRGIRAATIK